MFLLVIQNDVWSPNKIAGYSNDLKSIILIFIPAQISIMPDLTHPQVCGQHLVPFILAQRVKHKAKVIYRPALAKSYETVESKNLCC